MMRKDANDERPIAQSSASQTASATRPVMASEIR
jgi:hypothetical protein